MKLALVHDWLNQIGGAEDVLNTLHGMYPDSPIYTSIYAPDAMPAAYRQWDIRTLWLDRMPGIHRHHQPYLPLYPMAWGGLDLSEYDVVLSNKSGFCHGVQHDADTLHVCYCLAPTRYVWQFEHYVEREGLGRTVELGLRPLISALQRWDYAAAQRVDHFISISTDIQQRVRRFYDRDSEIIYPPVETARFAASRTDAIGDYYLIVSRLVPYKRIDLAVQAANRLKLPLKIGGRGRDLERLKAMAGPTVEFLGFVPDEALPDLMARAKAFLFPGFEDFGITPVQSQAAGRPVIAYGGGGALDTVLAGRSGEHFSALTVDSLAAVWDAFDPFAYDPNFMQAHAAQFDSSAFQQQLRAAIQRAQTQITAPRK